MKDARELERNNGQFYELIRTRRGQWRKDGGWKGGEHGREVGRWEKDGKAGKGRDLENNRGNCQPHSRLDNPDASSDRLAIDQARRRVSKYPSMFHI